MRKALAKSLVGCRKITGSCCCVMSYVIFLVFVALIVSPNVVLAEVVAEVYRQSGVEVTYWTAEYDNRYANEDTNDTGDGISLSRENMFGSSGYVEAAAMIPLPGLHMVYAKAQATEDVACSIGQAWTYSSDLLRFDREDPRYDADGYVTICYEVRGNVEFGDDGSVSLNFFSMLGDGELVSWTGQIDADFGGGPYSRQVCGAAHYTIGQFIIYTESLYVDAWASKHSCSRYVELHGSAEADFSHTARMVSITPSEGHYLAYTGSGATYPPEVEPPPPVATTTGTIGTQVTMDGPGFGNRKGKVLVGGAATKIIAWTDASITYEIKKGLPVGPYDVVVQRKDPKGAEPLTYEGAFTMAAPEIASVDPTSGIPNDQVVILGNYFGTKKGKLYIEDPATGKKKNCKVISWGMESITFAIPKLPKNLSTGVAYPLKLINKAKATAETIFTVLEPEP